MFGQHSAEAAIFCFGVWYVCSRGRFIIGLGSPCCWLHGSLYLLMALSNVLEDGGENFQFLSEGIFVTESFGSVYQRSEY